MRHPMIPSRRQRYRRGLRWSLLLLLLALVLPLVPYALAASDGGIVRDGGIGLWQAIRQGDAEGDVRSQLGANEGTVLINTAGEAWRQFRVNRMLPMGGWLLLGTLALIALFFAIRGCMHIAGGRSGKLVPRFTVNQRVIHWFAAGLFVLLGLTGLVLLYGRLVLIPLLGPAGFAVTASACKEIHNLFGPLFPFAVLALVVQFGRGNLFRWVDVKWLLRAGGMLGGHGADAGYYNGGQKGWFWLTVLFGIAISVSGLVLDFPVLDQGRELMTAALVVHGVVALLFIAVSLGHIYIGTVGMEGALESMTGGYVDANWAKEHHSLWFAEMERAGLVGVEPHAIDEALRHDAADFKGFGSPGSRATEG